MHWPTKKSKNVIVSPAMKITIRNATEIHDRITANATLTRSESQKTQWPQYNRDNEAIREISKMISKNYSKDLALYILKESTRSSSALTFTSLSNNVNWKKRKRRKTNKTMKMETRTEPWDSSNPPTGST